MKPAWCSIEEEEIYITCLEENLPPGSLYLPISFSGEILLDLSYIWAGGRRRKGGGGEEGGASACTSAMNLFSLLGGEGYMPCYLLYIRLLTYI